MGEAILAGGAATNDGSPKYKKVLFCDIIESNQLYTVPECINQELQIMLFGGGGIGAAWSGGSSGNMNIKNISLGAGSNVQINIGEGGNYRAGNNTGGTTFFGSYFSATGGGLYAGGAGGGGGAWISSSTAASNGTYGGGGGGCKVAMPESYPRSGGQGNGGIYGGGGGGSGGHVLHYDSSGDGGWEYSNATGEGHSVGGQYGGNGGDVVSTYGKAITRENYSYFSSNVYLRNINGNDGINTYDWTNVYKDLANNNYFRGVGKGGNGGVHGFAINSQQIIGSVTGSGGGYGGNGGKASDTEWHYSSSHCYCGGAGGGGGYGGDGGNGYAYYDPYSTAGVRFAAGGGGGGGWGSKGGDAYKVSGGVVIGGSGGGYGPAGYGKSGKFAAGGDMNNPAGNGLCLVFYQKLVMT